MKGSTRKWLHAAIFSIVVLLTLPIGPSIRDFLSRTFGDRFVIYSVALILVVGLLAAFFHAVRSERRFSPSQVFWFLIIGFLYWFLLKRTFRVPIESVHFVEYGILSLLVYRALRESFDETHIMLASFLITYSLGTIDEFIQWLLPNRIGALRDILFNAASGGLVQLLLWRGINPLDLVKGLPARSFRISAILISCNLLATGAFISLVSDFGYRIQDPEVGTFFSRMNGEEIARRDSLMWKHYRDALDASWALPYMTFLAETDDPFLYEMRVRIFRRDRHFEDRSYAVACCEEQILEKYFGKSLAGSAFAWTEERIRFCEEQGRTCTNYRSPVSQELIVRFDEKEMWAVLAVLSAAFLFLGTRKSLVRSERGV